MSGPLFNVGWKHLTLALSCVVMCSCGSIEPEGPVDDKGKAIPIPPAGEQWLIITKVTPQLNAATISTQPTFELTFNQYIDEDSYLSYNVASLDSGGKRSYGSARYIMTRKMIRWTPYRALLPDFEYKLNIILSGVRSVASSPLWPEKPEAYYISSEPTKADDFDLDMRTRTWADVDAIFEAKCNRCHSDPQWGLPQLNWSTLTKARSTQRPEYLVRPYSPSSSYLMHKILGDYPERAGTVQPPPWDEESVALTEAQVWTIEKWIKDGAPGPL